ncbi:MAG: uridine kinase [Opitutales bacterium]
MGDVAGSFVIGVAGGSGSGKTTLAHGLVAALAPAGAVLLSVDRYYRDALAPEPGGGINFDHPSALELDLLAAHLETLRGGVAVEVPSYDFATHRRLPQTTRIAPCAFLVVEGILLLHAPAVRDQLDYSVFVEARAEVRHARRLIRDVRERGRTPACITRQIAATVEPMHAAFVEPSRGRADTVVSGEGALAQTVATLCEGIRTAAQGPFKRPR